jgi:ATP-dependent Clp protease adapter protein ClpS
MQAATPIAQSKNIKTNIRLGWIAGLTSALSILVFVHFSTFNFGLSQQYTAMLLGDAALTAALAYGVSRFSRLSAVLLLILFVTNEVVIWHRIPLVNEALMSYVLIFALILGIIGTVQYQGFLNHIQPGSRLAIFRNGFISPHYTVGIEIDNNEKTPDDFLISVLKKNFGMGTARAKQALQLLRTHGAVILPVQTKQYAEQRLAKLTAEAEQHGYPQVYTLRDAVVSASGVDNYATRSHAEGAKRLLAEMKWIYAQAHTLVSVEEGEIPQLDLAAYRKFRKEMEAEGFRYIGDIENLQLSNSPYSMLARTMAREMLSPQGDIIAAYYQVKPRMSRRLQMLGRGLLNGRVISAPRNFIASLKTRHCIDFISEFTLGGYLITSNAATVGKISHPQTIESTYFPFATPWPQLLQAHRQRLAEILQAGAGQVQAVVKHSLVDIINGHQRFTEQLHAYRVSVNWITEEELQAFARGKPELASVLYAEIQKLLKDEQSTSHTA